MKPAIALQATKDVIASYKRLLVEDPGEGLEHAVSVVELIRRHLLKNGLRLVFAWEPPSKPSKRAGIAVYPIPASASAALRDFLERANARAAEPLEDASPAEPADEVERVAAQCWVLLTLQAQFELAGSAELLRDAQSLLYLACVHDVLPALSRAGRRSQHALLAEAMWWHAANVWRDEPAHSLHLQARLHECLGDEEAAQEKLHLAFRLTPSSDHDYLTRGQAYWSSLMDQRRIDAARQFALELYRSAPPEALAEVSALVGRSYGARVAG